MKKVNSLFLIAILAVICCVFAQCNKTSNVVAQSSAKDILSFAISNVSPVVVGTIDPTTRQITVIVPASTDLTTLVPLISISNGATISPSSTSIQNFTIPVVYNVTAEDGSSQSYTVSITATGITTVSNLSGIYKGQISNGPWMQFFANGTPGEDINARISFITVWVTITSSISFTTTATWEDTYVKLSAPAFTYSDGEWLDMAGSGTVVSNTMSLSFPKANATFLGGISVSGDSIVGTFNGDVTHKDPSSGKTTLLSLSAPLTLYKD